jgi:hypothetical protein
MKIGDLKIGDMVRVTKIPEDLPETDQRLVTLFNACLGKEFKVAGFEDGLIELHVGEVFEQDAGKHRIWLAADHLKMVGV